MARILNACPVTIELARLAAQVREHAPYCGARPYTVALVELGRACGFVCDDDFERSGLLSDRLWLAVCCAYAGDLMSRDPALGRNDPNVINMEIDAMAHLMTSPEWSEWIAQRGAATGDDLTPEARAENEWKRNMADARVRNVTSLT